MIRAHHIKKCALTSANGGRDMGFLNADTFQTIGLVLGGIALFIFGVEQMSDGMKSIAGSKIRDYIKKYTSNLFMAILVGTIITALLQSSTAVTVISISLVRAGLMKLEQAIGITIGANIGTCITSLMVGLDIEQFAYYIVFVGVLVMLLSKKKRGLYIGKIILGFGLLFVGLQIMGDQLVSFADEPWFETIMVTIGQNSWLALAGGTVATAVLNSSTAVIGVVQKLYTTGLIMPAAGAAFIFGSNVGTCLTAIIAGAGGSTSSKRAAWFHAVYNIAGALIGMLLMGPFLHLTNIVTSVMHGSAEMWIAQTHLLFNIISTLLIIPFVKQSVKILELIIPGEDRQGTKIENIDEMDDTMVTQFPTAALEIAKKNTIRMGRNVLENIKSSSAYLTSKEEEAYDEIQEIEAEIDKYDTKLSKYLLKIAQQPTLSKEQTNSYSKNFQIVKNLERVSDLVVNLSNFYKAAFEEKNGFSKEAMEDLTVGYEIVEKMVEKAIYTYETNNADDTISYLVQQETKLKEFEAACRDRHFMRMRDDICVDPVSISVFVDILATLERIGDYSLNIANTTVSVNVSHDVATPVVVG